MKKSRFTDSQIMDALRRVEAGLSAADICRALGISTGEVQQNGAIRVAIPVLLARS